MQMRQPGQFDDVLLAHCLVGYPSVMIGGFLIHFEPLLKKIDLIGITGAACYTF
jgi:hypothetical protein